MNRPFGMLAELTYACPLHCPYCSNPLNLTDYRDELTTAEWQRVLTGLVTSAYCSFTSRAASRSGIRSAA